MAGAAVTQDGRARVLADGNEIPLLGLGVWQVPDGPECEDAVRWALEAGYRHVDTAQAYGNERSVGNALRDSGVPREDVFITTKFYPARKDGVEVRNAEVGDADGAGIPLLLCSLHPVPRPGRAALRPVDDVEVHGVDAEALEAALHLRLRVAVAGVELRGDEHLLARQADLTKGASDAALVPVCLGGVDLAISRLESPAHGVFAGPPVWYLPHAEPEKRDLVAVGQHSIPSVCRYRAWRHGALLPSKVKRPDTSLSRTATGRSTGPRVRAGPGS